METRKLPGAHDGELSGPEDTRGREVPGRREATRFCDILVLVNMLGKDWRVKGIAARAEFTTNVSTVLIAPSSLSAATQAESPTHSSLLSTMQPAL